jgi:hypothetical protein
MANLIFLMVSLNAVILAIKEVGFPMGILSALLAWIFSMISAIVWEWALYPQEWNLRNGPIFYVIQVFMALAFSAPFLMLIEIIPGRTPHGLLTLASAYAFFSVNFRRRHLKIPPST